MEGEVLVRSAGTRESARRLGLVTLPACE